MAFKEDALVKTISGTFQSPTGIPAQGKLSLRLTEPVMGRDEGVVYTRETDIIELDANGSFAQDIVVTKRTLTAEEQINFDTLKADMLQAADDLDAVQQLINEYLTAQSEGTVPTPQQAEAYRLNLIQKSELSAQIIDLNTQINTIEVYKKKIESRQPVLNIRLDFDVRRQGRLNLSVYVPLDGPNELNLSDLEIAY